VCGGRGAHIAGLQAVADSEPTGQLDSWLTLAGLLVASTAQVF
jgi:hypothetical protein